MKKLILLVFLLASSLAFGAASDCAATASVRVGGTPQPITTGCTNSQTTTVSGTALRIDNNVLGMTPSFEETFATGAPASASIVIAGCKVGTTCDTLETNTSTSGGIRAPTVSKIYDYFTVTPTWSGGTATGFTVSTTVTTSRSSTGSGITGATTGGGLVATGSTLGLLTTCSSTQVLAWNGSAWACAAPGSVALDGVGNPTANKSFDMTTKTLNFNFTGNWGSGFGYSITSNGSNASTGPMFQLSTGASTTHDVYQFCATGTSNCEKMTSAGLITTIGTSTFDITKLSTGHPTLEGVTATGATGTGKLVFDGTPTLVTPVIGAATGTSLYATGIIDGKATMNVSTTTPCTLGTASANCSAVSSLSGYTVNEHATAATAIVYNLPTAAAGLQYCVANGFNGTAANTGTLELLTSATGQFIIYTDGTLSATHGNVTSTGAAGDAACVVGVDTTHWMLYVQRGSWTKN